MLTAFECNIPPLLIYIYYLGPEGEDFAVCIIPPAPGPPIFFKIFHSFLEINPHLGPPLQKKGFHSSLKKGRAISTPRGIFFDTPRIFFKTPSLERNLFKFRENFFSYSPGEPLNKILAPEPQNNIKIRRRNPFFQSSNPNKQSLLICFTS